MKLIGITGGIGTGKSTVAGMLRTRGWTVYASDETAREIMDSRPEVQQEIARAIGEDVLTPQGLDRKKIAELVFGESPLHKQRREAIEKIIHPLVIEEHWERIQEHLEQDTPCVAIDSALLYEIGLEDGFDWVIVVDAPDEIRIKRVMERSNLTEAQVRARMAEQLTMQEKRSYADFVIENAGTRDELENAVNRVATIIEVMPISSE
jgi:dephospho-CoA kinase